MENLEDLKRRIRTATDLHSLVRTMKALAAVNIRQLEHAVDSADLYRHTIKMGLQIILRNRQRARFWATLARTSREGLIVFGSDQGMCGQLNDLVARKTVEQLNGSSSDATPLIIAVGARVAARLEELGHRTDKTFSVAHSTAGIIPLVQDLLVLIDQWRQRKSIDKVVVIFSEHTSRATYEVRRTDMLPLDRGWLENMRKQRWSTNQVPTFTMAPGQLFSALLQQYLFVTLYRSCAESQASENAARLAAMQGAEKNIGNRIEGLTREFHQTRQMSITEELLDIASGFEAIRSQCDE